jgi:predicted PurR-regulated permease PerM
MSNGRHLTFWLLVFLVGVGLLWLLNDVLLPFVAGFALAYLQVPVVDWLERRGINRTAATLSIVVLIMVAIIAALLIALPLLAQQLSLLIASMPAQIARLRQIATDWLTWLQLDESTVSMSNVVSQASTWLSTLAASLWSGGKALASFASILIIMPVVTFYLIVDWHQMIAVIDGWIPVRHRDSVRGIARDVDVAIAGFVRGQLLVCVGLGIYYAVALSLVGLKFAILIGLISGLITFVPYIGSLTGLIVGTAIAVAQFWPDWKWIGAVVAVFLVGQFIEGNIIAPKLVGDRVGLHPVWLIFAMFAFGYLFGFVGLLLAVPIAAAVAVLFRFGLKRYLASSLYTGERSPAP